MFKKQLLFQKIICILGLIISTGIFVYSLGFMTDLYKMYIASSIVEFDGVDLFYMCSEFNEKLVIVAIICFVSSVLPFIFANNKRRIYYIDNYIISAVLIVVFVFSGIYILINTINFKQLFLTTVDFETYRWEADTFKFEYSDSTLIFDLGLVIFIVVIIYSLLVSLNLVWKHIIVKEEYKLINGETKNE